MANHARRLTVGGKILRKLRRLARAISGEYRIVVRAKIVLLAIEGISAAKIASMVGTSERTVREWRRRFAQRPRLGTLLDRRRSGKPSSIEVQARCEVIKLACERPDTQGADQLRFRDVWTYSSLHIAANDLGLRISRTEIYRTLHNRNIRPHRVQMWLHSQDPKFREKANKLCKLYLNIPKSATVVCVDEKTGMQALERKHPSKPARIGVRMRMEYEYIRHGTRSLIAAFNVRTGKVHGHCGPTRKADDLVAFMEQLARQYPRGIVYVVWDNLNIHHGERWAEFDARHGGRFRFMYTPLHASWLNQVEIWFGILHKRLLRHGSYTSARELATRVDGFIKRWNDYESHPFRWSLRGFDKKTGLRLTA